VGAFAREIAACEGRWNRPHYADNTRRALGVITLILVAGGSALVAWAIASGIWHAAGPWARPLLALAAWPALAQRSLLEHYQPVFAALRQDDLVCAREAVGMIVGRDTASLDEAGVASAAIETLAESFCDGIIAPLFWLLVLGLPGLWAFKAVSTADSLIGHPEQPLCAFGWASARCDDALNLIPARLSALLICLVAGKGWRVLWRSCQACLAQCRLARSRHGRRAECPPGRSDQLRWRRAGQAVDRPWRAADDRIHARGTGDISARLCAGVADCRRDGMGALMLQGTGSDVGKSVLVAGLCRALANRGIDVLPFKPRNMSNNAAVTVDGGEIGRAQALQALAARAAPHTDMNPVLLKPQADRTSQLVVHGKVRGTFGTAEFREGRRSLLPEVLESWARLRARCEIVVVEGAGSPAEINLREGDIANMGFARATQVPVVLVGDIDRGGVIASLVGTRAVLDVADAAMIRGFIVNKFRGDPALFADGYAAIGELTGWRGYGLVPWIGATARLPSEDAVILERGLGAPPGRKLVACPILPRISNFDDLDPLKAEPGIELAMIPPGTPIPADAAMIVLPGSKATIADTAFLRAQGWDIDILAHHRRGGVVLGICGGFQMLGQRIADPLGIEGEATEIAGLGLIDVETRLTPEKRLRHVTGTALGAALDGYEMHMGETLGSGASTPFARLDDGRRDGAIKYRWPGAGHILPRTARDSRPPHGPAGAHRGGIERDGSCKGRGRRARRTGHKAGTPPQRRRAAHPGARGTDMNRLLVLGGARSGKSRYAQRRIETLTGRLVYIATVARPGNGRQDRPAPRRPNSALAHGGIGHRSARRNPAIAWRNSSNPSVSARNHVFQ